MKSRYRFDLDISSCLFCGACESIAPDHFFVDPQKHIAEIRRQPKTEAELSACRAAMINCPGSAIAEIALPESDEIREAPSA